VCARSCEACEQSKCCKFFSLVTRERLEFGDFVVLRLAGGGAAGHAHGDAHCFVVVVELEAAQVLLAAHVSRKKHLRLLAQQPLVTVPLLKNDDRSEKRRSEEGEKARKTNAQMIAGA
jgi:hypothetical protein